MEKRTAENIKTVRSFVRRGGRITKRQKRAYARLYERVGVRLGEGHLDFVQLFGRRAPVILEIGFGMGYATAEIAAQFPDRNFLAVDVHIAGIGNLVALCEERGLENIRIIEGDALDILAHHIPDGVLTGLHIYFPDPWPKKRHHKRRLLQAATLPLFCRKLESGGYLHVATDWQEYAEEILRLFEQESQLRNTAAGFASRPVWRPRTRFEEKALKEGRRSFDILFRKI